MARRVKGASMGRWKNLERKSDFGSILDKSYLLLLKIISEGWEVQLSLAEGISKSNFGVLWILNIKTWKVDWTTVTVINEYGY